MDNLNVAVADEKKNVYIDYGTHSNNRIYNNGKV